MLHLCLALQDLERVVTVKMNKWEWSSYFKRQAKFLMTCLIGGLFFWNSVTVLEWAYELFDAELRGYGEGTQRWHRIWAVGFFLFFVLGCAVDTFNTLYYRKHPDRYPPARRRKE